MLRQSELAGVGSLVSRGSLSQGGVMYSLALIAFVAADAFLRQEPEEEEDEEEDEGDGNEDDYDDDKADDGYSE